MYDDDVNSNKLQNKGVEKSTHVKCRPADMTEVKEITIQIIEARDIIVQPNYEMT
jgi:hypothetical protein